MVIFAIILPAPLPKVFIPSKILCNLVVEFENLLQSLFNSLGLAGQVRRQLVFSQIFKPPNNLLES